MSKQKPTENREKSPGFKGYVNFYLSPSDKDQIKRSVMDDGQFTKFLASLAARGYKFGFSYDRLHSCYIVSATGASDDNPNNGYATTARHADLYIAATALWYQLDILSQEGRWPGIDGVANIYDW